MEISETSLPGVLVLKPKVYRDARGFFLETFRQKALQQVPLFVQDNHSRSQKNILRGLHAQKNFGQGKLIRVTQGKVFDVAVDIRYNSPTFGKWEGFILDDENHHQIYIPPGFAHGFYVLSDTVDFLYKCTEYYHPEDEIGIRWDDPTVAIDWPLIDSPVISEKDAQLPFLKNLAPDYFPSIKQYPL